MTPEQAKEILLNQYLYYGVMMVKWETLTEWFPVPAILLQIPYVPACRF